MTLLRLSSTPNLGPFEASDTVSPFLSVFKLWISYCEVIEGSPCATNLLYTVNNSVG